MYAAGAGQQQAGPQPGAGQQQASGNKGGDDVTDVDFEEVK